MKRTFLSILLAGLMVGGTWAAVTQVDWAALTGGAEQAGPEGGLPGGGGRPGGRGGDRAAVVRLAEVEVRPYADRFETFGTLRAVRQVTVQAEVAGRITEVLATPNAEVTAGDALVRLDDAVTTLEQRTARAQLAEVEQALARLETLSSNGSAAVSGSQVETARTAVEVARVAVDRAAHDLEARTVTAPISGRLGLTNLQEGAYVAVGTEIARITDLDSLVVDFSLPDRALDFLAPGLRANIVLTTQPGTVHSAEVMAVDTVIDATTRQIAVEARLDAPGAAVLPGSVVTVRVERPSSPAPAVPALAITWSREGAGVWAVVEGRTTRVPVEILHRSGDTVWLNAALEDGAQVVVEGVQKVSEGTPVSEPGTSPAAQATPVARAVNPDAQARSNSGSGGGGDGS
jgi:RND family efflux transporter MFP subunit